MLALSLRAERHFGRLKLQYSWEAMTAKRNGPVRCELGWLFLTEVNYEQAAQSQSR